MLMTTRGRNRTLDAVITSEFKFLSNTRKGVVLNPVPDMVSQVRLLLCTGAE